MELCYQNCLLYRVSCSNVTDSLLESISNKIKSWFFSLTQTDDVCFDGHDGLAVMIHIFIVISIIENHMM